MRLRHSQERGSGRAEEVVAALAYEMGLAVRLAAGVTGPEGEAESERSEPMPGPAAKPRPEAPRIDSAEAGSGAGEARDAGGVAEAGRPGRPPVEAVHAVRERLWLRDELERDEPKRDPSARRAEDGQAHLPPNPRASRV